MLARKEKDMSNVKDESQNDLERAEFLLYAALDADELQDRNEAIDLYKEAIELCLEAVRNVERKTFHLVQFYCVLRQLIDWLTNINLICQRLIAWLTI